MARCKNVGGSPPGGDGGDSPPRITEVSRGKRKVISTKKRTRKDREAKVALAVAQAAEKSRKWW
jgi:hypothetical protein